MKRALIIGADSDIAKAAIELLRKDYDSIIRLNRTNLDLADSSAQDKLTRWLNQADPDLIVNCAGVFGDNTTLDYDKTFDVNLRSNWNVIDYYIKNPPLKTVRVIMLGSSVYKQGRKNFILYAASKAALFNMWQGASEYVSDNVKLGIINPVHVNTKMTAHKPHSNPAICLEAIDVAQEIENLSTMTESRYIDIDYRREV